MMTSGATRHRTRPRPGRPGLSPREQSLTKFGVTLARFAEAVGATGAVLVDADGEAVDYAGSLDPFELKVIGAELRLILDLFKSVHLPGEQGIHEFALRARRKSFGVYELAEGYVVVVQLARRAFRVSRRALSEAVRELCEEAGLALPAALASDHWLRVDVREAADGSRRPAALWVEGRWSAVEVIGRWASTGQAAGPSEAGYRVRFEGGVEVNLVREPLDRWFADDAIHDWSALASRIKASGPV